MRHFGLCVSHVNVLILTLLMLRAKMTIEFLPTQKDSGDRYLNLSNLEVLFPP